MEGKSYCPYCRLELSGDRHLSDIAAWDRYNCEYRVSNSDKPPIPELEINNRKLKHLTTQKNAINKRIRQLKSRNLELANWRKENPL